MLDQHSVAGHLLNERPLYNTLWKITKFENADAFEEGKSFEEVEINGNILLNEGINSIWTLVAGGSETAFNNANARIGLVIVQRPSRLHRQIYKLLQTNYIRVWILAILPMALLKRLRSVRRLMALRLITLGMSLVLIMVRRLRKI